MSTYLTAEVCLNGHATTDRLERSPELSARFCAKCGKATITVCQNCNAGIRGEYYVEGGFVVRRYKPPGYCHECGSPFPWTGAKIAAAKDLADELDELTENDRNTLKKSIDDLSSDSPRTEVAVHRFKRIMNQVGESTVPVIRSLVVDIASETAKKLLG